MGRSISHRGPDDRGVFLGDRCALGNERLSVIDPLGGHQPFASADGSVVVVQNGEIFNYLELAQDLRREGTRFETASDTEVILRLYERYGIDFLRMLNGMFAIAIWDAREPCLWLARDRIGIKPLFTWRDAGRVHFASEIKALLRAGLHAAPDYRALHHFLGFNYVPPPLTAFRGVRHVVPGCVERYGPDGRSERRWWDLIQDREADAAGPDWGERFLEILADAVRIRMRADVPYGAFLSGGVDSSTIVALMARQSETPVRTFSIGFEDERFDESRYAAQAAERFGTVHTQRVVDPDMLDSWPLALYHCDQPHGDVSFLPTLRVSELAARDVTVVLTGDGGDELFAGYDKYRDFFAGPTPDGELDFRAAYSEALELFTAEGRRSLYGAGPLAEWAGESNADFLAPWFDASRSLDRVNRALHIDMSLLLPGNNLVKPDRMGMAVSLEARTPLLDHRMMEFAFGTPGRCKLRGGVTKVAFKDAVSDLIGVDLAHRRKQMLTVPIGEWFRGKLAPFVRSVLLSEESRDRALFEPRAVSALIEAHERGHENRTRELRALLAVELWARVFLDRACESPPVAEEILGVGIG